MSPYDDYREFIAEHFLKTPQTTIDGLQPAVIEYPDDTEVETRVRVTRGPAPVRKKKPHAGLQFVSFVWRFFLVVAALAAIGVGGAIYLDMNKPPPPEWETVSLEELGLPPDYNPFPDESE